MSEGPEDSNGTSEPVEEHEEVPEAPSTAMTRRQRWRRHRGSVSRRRRWAVRSAISLGLLIVVVAGATLGYSLFRFNQINRIPIKGIVRASGPTENILLIGSTDRCYATNIKLYRLQCSEGVNGNNSDVVLVAHLDPNAGTVSLLSIPRDTFVPDARSFGSVGCTSADNRYGCSDKIDAALGDQPDQLVAAIEQDYGIPINHFVEVNFNSFEAIVNAVGGLHMYFRYRLVDASSLLDVHHTGCLPFNGQEALELVRARHLYWFKKGQTPNMSAIQAATDNGSYYTADSGGQYDGSGDLGRITRVHLFLKALGQEVKKRGLGDPLTDNSLIGAVAPNLTVDSTFGDSELLHLALDFRNVDISSVATLTTPIVVDGDPNGYSYKGFGYGDVVFPTEPQDQATIDQFLGTTPKGWALAPSSIKVSVIDGTNSPAAAAAVSSELGKLGYQMVPTAQSLYVGPVAETTVVYAAGHLNEAQRVMSSLAGTVILGEGAPAGGAEVSVIAGSDLVVARAATSPTTTTAPAHATTTSASLTASHPGAIPAELTSATTAATTVPTHASTNADLGAPTSANPAPAPYDPRACPMPKKKS